MMSIMRVLVIAACAAVVDGLSPSLAQSDCKRAGPNVEVCLSNESSGTRLHPDYACYWPKFNDKAALRLSALADGQAKKFKVRVRNQCRVLDGNGNPVGDRELHVDVVLRVYKSEPDDKRLSFTEGCGGGQYDVTRPFKRLEEGEADTLVCKTAKYKRNEASSAVDRKAAYALVATGVHLYDIKSGTYKDSDDIEVALDPEIVLEKAGEAYQHWSWFKGLFR